MTAFRGSTSHPRPRQVSLAFAEEGERMRRVSRREALTGLSAAGVATLLVSPTGAARAKSEEAGGEVFIVGPFSVGKMYGKATARRGPGGPLAIGADPGRDKLIAALSECQLFLLDARDLSNP